MTKENYFQPNNRLLTNSKIKDYSICPNYFFRKHIMGEIKDDYKYHFAIGGAVDDILTQIKSKDKFICVSRRNLKNPPIDHIELNPTQYEEVMSLAIAVEETNAWQELQMWPDGFQNIIQAPLLESNKYFDCLAGIPDHYYIENDTCYITDLKTSQTIDENKYYWHSLEYGYQQQLAIYKIILKYIYPEIEEFVCRHIVVEKRKNVYPVKTFKFTKEMIEMGATSAKETILKIIKDTEFIKFNPTWEKSITL